MNARISLAAAVVAGLALVGPVESASAQVVEGRDAEANPASVIFRATLYGAGTGLALGGAYALIEQGDADTGDILRWGTALGTAGGLLVGLIYVATRSDPEGSVGEAALIQVVDGDVVLSPAFVGGRSVPLADARVRALEVRLVRVAH
jgi:hypothetical protein